MARLAEAKVAAQNGWMGAECLDGIILRSREVDMSLLHRLFATLHPRVEEGTKYAENLRAEDGFVPASQIRARGLLRIF